MVCFSCVRGLNLKGVVWLGDGLAFWEVKWFVFRV